MSEMITAFVFVTCLWFFSTGAILWLNRLDRETHPASLLGISVLCGPAVCGVIVSAHESSVSAAYLAFVSTLIIWGWHEMSFLMGFVAGPRRVACPEGARGWERFRLATATLIHHEIALAATCIALFAMTWGQPNQVAAQTFALLFAMRLCSKFNIFLGVANTGAEMMPGHLDYLKSYFRTRAMNPLFPFTLIGSGALALMLASAAFAAPSGSGEAAGNLLLLVLAMLGVIENCILMMPLRASALWAWAKPHATDSNQSRLVMIGTANPKER
jgi:putative photosynthetic complex assembly protein 2